MTWDKSADDLNTPQVKDAGGYVGPEKADQRLTYSQLREGLRSIKTDPNLDGIMRRMKIDEGDLFLRSGGSTEDEQKMRQAFDIFAASVSKEEKALRAILEVPFHVVVGDIMCDIRRIGHYSNAPWSTSDFDLAKDENNNATYQILADYVLRNYLKYFDRLEDGTLARGPGIMVLCGDIDAENELRSYQITVREEKLQKEAEKKAAAEALGQNKKNVLPPPKKKAFDPADCVIEDPEDDNLPREKRSKRMTFSEALEDRRLRYDVIIPGIGRNFAASKLLPKNLLLITRGVVRHTRISAREDKNVNQQEILRVYVNREAVPLTMFDNLAAILTPEGEIAAVSIGYAIAKHKLFGPLLKAYRPDLLKKMAPQILESPNICVCTIDGDLFPVCLTAYSLYKSQENVFLVHAGAGGKVKVQVNIAKYGRSVEQAFNSVENYLAILTTYGGDYVHSVNKVTPKEVAMAFLKSSMVECVKNGLVKLSPDPFTVKDIQHLDARWSRLRDLTVIEKTDERDLYPIKINHLYHIMLTLHRRFRASKPTPFKFMCDCPEPHVPSVCSGSTLEDINLHNSLQSSLTVEVYLNYLWQQLSMEVRIQVPVVFAHRLTGFYRNERGKVKHGIPPLFSSVRKPISLLFLLGLEEEEPEEQPVPMHEDQEILTLPVQDLSSDEYDSDDLSEPLF